MNITTFMLAGVTAQANRLGLNGSELAEVIAHVHRDWDRRHGKRLDKQQPPVNACIMIPCAGVRLEAYDDGDGLAYEVRRPDYGRRLAGRG